MDTVRSRSFARAGFLGNPSDGYFGKTISFTFRNFGVDLKLTESARLRFVPGEVDDATFESPERLVRDLRLYGYYGGIRLLKATSKRFFEYAMEQGVNLGGRNFTAEYKINIPRLVGLSGSSAICSAMLKALKAFYGVTIPEEMAPTIVMEAEREELGIACGLQDRVAQMYNGVVFMDFNQQLVESTGHGRYDRLEPLSPDALAAFKSRLYIAYDPNRAEESGKAHKKVKRLFQERNANVVAAMTEFAGYAEAGREAILKGDFAEVNRLVNANFDLRDRIFNVAEENRHMVLTARKSGASAKFAGSGGAIVGLAEDGEQFARLTADLAAIGCTTLRPVVASTADETADFAEHGVWRNS